MDVSRNSAIGKCRSRQRSALCGMAPVASARFRLRAVLVEGPRTTHYGRWAIQFDRLQCSGCRHLWFKAYFAENATEQILRGERATAPMSGVSGTVNI